MVDVDGFARTAQERFLRAKLQGNAFYGDATALAIGAGVIAGPLRYPLYNLETGVFNTVEGDAIVFTHECDIDPGNNRYFNDYFVICPVTPLAAWLEECVSSESEGYARALVDAIAADEVNRVFYLPPHNVPSLRHGALLYLNQMTSTHVGSFELSSPRNLCALSTYGQRALDWKLENHFKRPKDDQLPQVTSPV